MVLEMKAPRGTELSELGPVLPAFLSYVLSFIYLGIYWTNHHHLLHEAKKVDGRVLWANLHLLFWLPLVPSVTAWLGGNHGAPWPSRTAERASEPTTCRRMLRRVRAADVFKTPDREGGLSCAGGRRRLS